MSKKLLFNNIQSTEPEQPEQPGAQWDYEWYGDSGMTLEDVGFIQATNNTNNLCRYEVDSIYYEVGTDRQFTISPPVLAFSTGIWEADILIKEATASRLGFRLQVSNGTLGIQFTVNKDGVYVSTSTTNDLLYNTTMIKVADYDLMTRFKMKVVFYGDRYEVFIDDSLIYESTDLADSGSYCTVTRVYIINQIKVNLYSLKFREEI